MRKVSLVIPVYNEEESIPVLLSEIANVPLGADWDYEVIAVDDGSQDKSYEALKKAAGANFKIKVIRLRWNFGQTAAMSAGFNHAGGEVIVPLDADLQNDPNDLPLFLKTIDEGFDIVSGWRKNRQDKLWSRKVPSWVANAIISRVTGVKLHDFGCTMKAYRREAVADVHLYGEMHRFIPALVGARGIKIGEIVTHHRERRFGRTKYGISRTLRVILDLFTVKFLKNYSTKPMHFFGGAGLLSLLLGVIALAAALYLRFTGFATLIQTPLPLLAAFFGMAGLQFVLMGLLAEMIMRNYFESQNKKTYVIQEKINFSK